tara:strand:+ start:698 stop:1753 length:1056 start_codon:yes stop_codon:yes gene_type:complete
MNNLLNYYSINYCSESELKELQHFIHDHWKNNHSLVISKKLMDWQHFDKENGIYNYVIAKHIETNKIHGIIGFISTKHFDKSLNYSDLWLTTWKIRDDIQYSGLGLYLLKSLVKYTKARSVSSIGIDPQTIPIYKYLGYKVGFLNHYYLINIKKNTFNLVGNFNGKYNSSYRDEKGIKLYKCNKTNFFKKCEGLHQLSIHKKIPTKTLSYIYCRYYCHPIYEYHIYVLVKNDVVTGIVVIRLDSYNSYHALRLIDFLGEDEGLSGLFSLFQKLIQEYSAEYIDFYNIGIDKKILNSSGFLKREINSEVIIPSNFNPFEKINIDIAYAYKCDHDYLFTFFKGDCDQDRPSVL